MTKPKTIERYIAYLLDIIPMTLLVLIPIIGGLIAALYILFRDALLNGQSVGKKILTLRVVKVNGNNPATLRESALRNFPLALNFFFPIIPVVGHILGGVTAIIIFTIEAISIATDKDGRRLGDKMAGTIVIREED
jgi:uncharacterized RDD family membrane protein YckC